MCLFFSFLLLSKNVNGHKRGQKSFVLFLDVIGDNVECKFKINVYLITSLRLRLSYHEFTSCMYTISSILS